MEQSPDPIPRSSEATPTGRRVLAGWFLGAGFAVLAMALPEERLIGPLAGETGWLPSVLLRLLELGGLAELGPEALGFVLSALAFGACFPVMLSIARRSELPFGLSVSASLIVLLSPVAWLTGTLPGNGAVALLFALLCLRSLWGPRADRNGWALLFWAVAASSSPVFLWLLPAVTAGVGLRSEERSERLWKAAAAFLLGVGAYLVAQGLWLSWLPPAIHWTDAGEGIARQAVFGGSGGWGQALAWGTGLFPGLGLGALAVASLFFLKRREAEARPPRWLLVWCALPLLAVGLGGSPAWDVPYLWLLPPALIGGVDLLARLDKPIGERLAVVAVLVQLSVLAGVLFVVHSTDPLSGWRATAAKTLREGDVVFTADPDHAYLLGRRWELEVVVVLPELTDPAGSLELNGDWLITLATAENAGGRRVVFDLDVPEGLREEAERLIQRIEKSTSIVRMESE